ncbi:ABC transporter ATP-binding protein [Dactylosporangium cerinum]|uniref:ABC transporter ATP-binding protein n=1 Tax=Dactylosporangium cerinum TaxID=1434730 RepID=A0ABV9W487_9ACTN
MTEFLVEATGLYHIYRERDVETVALRGARLALRPGSWTSLTGPSGSGKSTLLQILAGLLTPTAGAVLVDGDDMTRMTPDERARCRRRRIGVVLQRDNLHPGLDVAGNIALPLRLDGQPAGAIRDRVGTLLDEVGLADRRHRWPARLSGGEAQRAAVAVAVAARPAVLLADEPTGELDERSTSAVLDLLEAARAAHGTAILTVTHNPAVAERAGRSLVMRDGVIGDD